MGYFMFVSGTIGPEVAITPGTARVLGSNLTGPVFLYKRSIPFHKKIVASLFVCLYFVDLVVIL